MKGRGMGMGEVVVVMVAMELAMELVVSHSRVNSLRIERVARYSSNLT